MASSAPVIDSPSCDMEAERAIIGSTLLWTGAADIALERGLRKHHFYRDVHQIMWSAITTLRDRDVDLDPLIVFHEIERQIGTEQAKNYRGDLDEVTSAVPAVGNAPRYAERVVELAEWRDRRTAALALLEATGRQDRENWARATGLLDRAGRERRNDSLTPEQWGELILDYLTVEDKQEGFIPLPFNALTNAMGGGILPGESMLIAGYTFHGKSIVADQILDKAAQRGKRCHLYMTEMTAAQRGLRYVARQTGIPFSQLRSRATDAKQLSKIIDELNKLPYGVSVVADWDMNDVARDALRSRWDLVVIDLIHGFHYQDERDLDALSKSAMRLARVSTTRVDHSGTAVVMVAHLSGAQMREQRSAKRPRPAMHSIKGAQSLSQDVDYVLFVWQQDDENGLPTGTGAVYMPKARGGGSIEVPVHLNTSRFRFEALEPNTVEGIF